MVGGVNGHRGYYFINHAEYDSRVFRYFILHYLCLYLYTLKRTTALSVAIGAIPGALPLIIGCVAYEQVVSPMAMYLFALQFFWQFPHFWAVAWVADEDYKRAGFYLLPSRNGEKDQVTGMLSFIFCLLLILIPELLLVWVDW
ncbi:MAG: UbiA family prenyltransferase [Saprospiraceae bacterium]